MSARPSVTLRPGELVVDSDKAANLVHEHLRLARALHDIERLDGLAEELRETADTARRALALAPEYDAIPPTVVVDPSWADARPACIECGEPVAWIDALLMPCAVHDGDPVVPGVVHRDGCPEGGR